MNMIKQGFVIKNEVLSIGYIKPGGSGVLENGKSYKASVKFNAVNISEELFEGTIREVSQEIEYKVSCDSNEESATVTDFLRNARTKNIPIYINSSIPRLPSKGSTVFVAVSNEQGQDFININRGVKDIKSVEK